MGFSHKELFDCNSKRDEMKLTVLTTGGIGNTYFQVIAGRAIALETKKELKIVDTGIVSREKQNQSFDRLTFNFSYNYSKKESLSLITRLLLKIGRIRPFRNNLARIGVIVAIEVNDDLSWCKHLTRSWLLLGFFQNEFFFNKIPESERLPVNLNRQEDPNCNGEKYQTVIHVRHGDYYVKTNPQGVLEPDYYKNAVDYLKIDETLPVLVVSDDILGAMKYLHHEFPMHKFVPSKNNTLGDLKVMAACDNLICANSSFSLMAALLNSGSGEVVVPDPFYKFGKFDLNAFPNNWKKRSRN